jgi:hypothetical protein
MIGIDFWVMIVYQVVALVTAVKSRLLPACELTGKLRCYCDLWTCLCASNSYIVFIVLEYKHRDSGRVFW